MIRLLVRLSARAVVLVLVGGWVVVAASAPASAQETCSERVPWLAFIDGEAADRSSGDWETSSAWAAPVTVGAGGATALGVGTAVTYTAGSVSAFFAASMLTCGALDVEIGGHSLGGFLDAIVGNSMQIGPPPVEHENIAVFNAPCYAASDTSIGGFNGIASSAAWPATTGGQPGACRYVRMSGFSSGRASTQSLTNTSGRHVIADNVERTVGGNVLPAKEAGSSYPVTQEVAVVAMCRNGSLSGRCNSTGTSAGYNTAGAWDPRTLAGVFQTGTETLPTRTWIDSQTATERLLVSCLEAANIGGVCGVTPGRLFAVVNGAVPEIEAVFQPFPEAQTHGWKRRYVVDVRCHANTTATWKRVESDLWWDATVNQRIPVPACPTGQLLTAYRIADVPQNITCAAASSTGCVAPWLLETWTAPSEWLATSTAPVWTECLQAGNACGDPALVEATCTWGSHTVIGDFCDPEQQIDAGAIPTTATISVNPTPVTDAPVSTLDPVVDPDTDPGGGGTDIEVPIDSGDGRRCETNQTEACFGPVTEGHGEECFPNGWGWFNPAEWVLRPIKCAMVWAFVPSDEDTEAFVTSVRTSVEGTFPLSLFVVAIDLADAFADSAQASAATCVDLDMTVSGVDPGCMAIPSNMLTPAQMAVIRTGLVCSLVLAVAWASIRLVTS